MWQFCFYGASFFFLISKMKRFGSAVFTSLSPPCHSILNSCGSDSGSEMAFHLLVVHRQGAQPDLLPACGTVKQRCWGYQRCITKNSNMKILFLQSLSRAKTRTNIYLIWKTACPLWRLQTSGTIVPHPEGILICFLCGFFFCFLSQYYKISDYCIVHNNSKVQEAGLG